MKINHKKIGILVLIAAMATTLFLINNRKENYQDDYEWMMW